MQVSEAWHAPQICLDRGQRALDLNTATANKSAWDAPAWLQGAQGVVDLVDFPGLDLGSGIGLFASGQWRYHRKIQKSGQTDADPKPR